MEWKRFYQASMAIANVMGKRGLTVEIVNDGDGFELWIDTEGNLSVTLRECASIIEDLQLDPVFSIGKKAGVYKLILKIKEK